MKLMPFLYQVAGVSLSHRYDASAYLIEGTDGLYLLDCGTPDGFELIEQNMRGLGFDPADLKAIYGTHGHYDHMGAAALWKNRYGCLVYIHELDRRQVEEADPVKTTASLLYGREFPACPVDGILKDGQHLAFGNGISMEVLYTPGHTMGSVCFALQCGSYSFLAAGDTVWGGFSRQIGSDETLWAESLEKLTSRHFDGYTFGHIGATVVADADVRLAEAKRQFGIYYNPWFKPMKDEFRYS